MKLQLQPITLAEAKAFVLANHRHHDAPVSGKFAIGLNDGKQVIGVAIVGRPLARLFDDGLTAEVTRLCVLEGYKNACRAMGYRKVITYILKSEPGISLAASGWKCVGECRGKTWNTPSRRRVDKTPLQEKLRFEIS